jgi:sorting nexin-1/2
MLNKIAAHPTLQHDGDLKLFLESEAFNVDLKHRERKEPLVAESKGMLSSIGIGSGPAKFVEHDDVGFIAAPSAHLLTMIVVP